MHPYQALAGLVFCVLMNSVRAFVRLSRSSSVALSAPGAGWASGVTAGARRSVAVGAHAVDCMCEACSNICKAAYGPCDCARCAAGLAKTACLPGCAGCDLCATLAACAPGCAGCDNCR
mmetsp:Transcript_22147/g.66472  ORF Transcript_22147/g.66472 Transcript_22147/m.66472 type:complete len:119 (-) Transcript_22147:56-412(-)